MDVEGRRKRGTRGGFASQVGPTRPNRIGRRFGIPSRRSIRRTAFAGVNVLIKQIRDYLASRKTDAPFTWTATVGKILANVRVVAANIKKIVKNYAN
ncbi:hypothetical protein [Streptomyces wuyuanensis]|uniref:hypothetical protein n=1 Tax=Streptomyces wuyuanensis TaxID=1196353 RepID=UPI003D720039